MWRKLRWVLLVTVLAIAGKAVEILWSQHAATQELEKVIAELDAADPDWRLEAIEAKRKKIPEDENAALFIAKISKAIPLRPELYKLQKRLQIYAPNRRLRPKDANELEDSLTGLNEQVFQALALRKFSEGRFPINYADNLMM